MFRFLFILFAATNACLAADKPDPCQLFEYCRGSSFRSTQSSSSPSPASSAALNPSNISSIRGMGVEAIYQPRNSILFDIASGNGKIGALISPTLENSFFGNRTIELDDVQQIRQEDKKQYKNKKYNFASGFKLIDRKQIGIDLGLSAKWNEDIKVLNPGFGATLRIGFLHLGAYRYSDDIKIELENYIDPYTSIPYSLIYKNSIYKEKFWVETYTGGFRLKNFTFDAGVIKTRYHFYPENTRIYIYSATYNWKDWLFLAAIRKEFSPNFAYVNKVMIEQRKKEEIYYGFQFLVNRHVILGANYNFFLLRELSGSLTILI